VLGERDDLEFLLIQLAIVLLPAADARVAGDISNSSRIFVPVTLLLLFVFVFVRVNGLRARGCLAALVTASQCTFVRLVIRAHPKAMISVSPVGIGQHASVEFADDHVRLEA
jgi:hypothetical protein